MAESVFYAEDIHLLPIGRVLTPFSTGAQCPRSGEESLEEGVLEVYPAFAPGLQSIAAGQWISLLCWLHEADRSVLSTHPRGDVSRPKRGVFNTRSPARPNPIGIHDVRVLEALPAAEDGTVRLRVDHVDMMSGTPVVDIKATYLQRKVTGAAAELKEADKPGEAIVPAADGVSETLLPQVEAISAACRDAWQRGLFSGFNGNVSVRSGSVCLITRSGCAKSSLGWADFSVINIADAGHIAGPPASSEAAMHCAVYRRMPKVDSVAHTHPGHLLALGMCRHPLFPAQDDEIFERRQLVARLGWVKEHLPGSSELAEAVGEAARSFPAIWMHRHGLTTCGANPHAALALAEEFDHLARVELLRQSAVGMRESA